MSENYLNVDNEKKFHKQGPNWDVVGRYEDFTSADDRRHKEIKDGRTAKVHKLSASFVVKVKPNAKVEVQQNETVVGTKKERTAGKQKRQDREGKR